MSARSQDQVQTEMLSLLPTGWAWGQSADSVIGGMLLPTAAELARGEGLMLDLLEQADPRTADAMLEDWERLLGDDPCLGPSAELPAAIRNAVAHQRLIARGGASIPFLVSVAATMGVAITIEETELFETGVSETGTEMVGASDDVFEWIVRLPGDLEVVDFETGISETGEAMGDWVSSTVECLIRRHVPAHTTVYFTYEG